MTPSRTGPDDVDLIRRRPIRWRDPGPGGRVALLVALYVAMVWGMFRLGPYAELAASGRTPLLEETFRWTAAEGAAWIGSLGEVIEPYRRFQAVDLLGAAFASLVLITVIQWGVGRVRGEESGWHDLALVPLAVCAAELVENASLFTATFFPPDTVGGILSVGLWATRVKFVLGAASFLIAGGAVLAGWWNLWITRA